ncbi:MAG: hypothetical protein JST93_01000 [Acidobacteria bacterium]|nr:hypothetical protein [Acidobacteriota bacterium]
MQTAATTLDPPISVVPRTRFWTPSLTDFFFFATIFWLFLAEPGGWDRLLWDGDTALHTRTGDWILDHGAVPVVDPFSYTQPGERWFAFQWFTGVLFAWLNRMAGLKGIVLVCGGAIALTMTILVRDMVRRGASGLIAIVLALVATNAMSIHFHARPHLFTLLFLAIGHYLIARDLEQPSWRVWLIVPLVLTWVNMHSGFPVMIATLGLLTAGRGLSALCGDAPWKQVFRYGILTALAALATLANPNGIALHQHISKFLSNSWILQYVDEYKSPVFRSEPMYYFMVILFTGLMAARTQIEKRNWHTVLWLLFFGAGSLVSARHVPIFMVVALPAVALELTGLLRQWAEQAGRKSTAEVLYEIGEKTTQKLQPISVWSPALLCLAAVFSTTWPVDLSAKYFPTTLVRKNAELLAGARVFTTDQWGDYLLWVNYPRQKVFMDGRSDFFQQKTGGEYLKISNGQDGWRESLERYGVNVVLAPPDLPLARNLGKDPAWREADKSKMAVLLVRR